MKQNPSQSLKSAIWMPAVIILLVLPLLAVPQTVYAVSAAPATSGPSDPAEVQTFVDDLMNGYLDQYHISGATVAVVGGGELLYAQGYGSADLAESIPFDAERHLFRIGSTSKLFIWVSAMQLVEQGRLDLDADINTYLKDFQIKNPYAQPVTMHHLMSHTAGFEESAAGMSAPNVDEILPLSQFLADFQPAIVRRPGEINAYSNYGAALAAHVVENITGMPFDQYVEEHIYKPLGMQRSTLRQPLPPELASDLALGYSYKNGFVEQPFSAINPAPAGAMNAAATDLAKFIIALIQDDCQAHVCLLKPETFQQLRQRIYPQDLRLDGMAHGFMDRRVNGVQFLDHGGAIPPYYGMLVIQGESNVGFYVGFIGDTGALKAVGEFKTAFLDHYFPFEPEIPAGKAITPVEQLTGVYRVTRSVYTTIDRIAEITNLGFVRVSENEVGDLIIKVHKAAGESSGTYVEVEPLVFRSSDGRSTAIFQPDPDGSGMVFFMSGDADRAYESIPWYEVPTLHLILFAGCFAVILSFLLVRFISLFFKRKPSPAGAKRARAFVWILCLWYALLVVGSIWYLTASASLHDFRWVLTVFGWLTVMTTLAILFSAVQAWRRAYWKLFGRVHYTLTALACAFMLWPLFHWNVIKFLW